MVLAVYAHLAREGWIYSLHDVDGHMLKLVSAGPDAAQTALSLSLLDDSASTKSSKGYQPRKLHSALKGAEFVDPSLPEFENLPSWHQAQILASLGWSHIAIADEYDVKIEKVRRWLNEQTTSSKAEGRTNG